MQNVIITYLVILIALEGVGSQPVRRVGRLDLFANLYAVLRRNKGRQPWVKPRYIQRHLLCHLIAFPGMADSWCPFTFCLLPAGFCLLSLPITSWKQGKSELIFHLRRQRRQQKGLGSNGGSNIYLGSLGLFAYLVFPAKLHSSYAGQQLWPTRVVGCGVNSSWEP